MWRRISFKSKKNVGELNAHKNNLSSRVGVPYVRSELDGRFLRTGTKRDRAWISQRPLLTHEQHPPKYPAKPPSLVSDKHQGPPSAHSTGYRTARGIHLS
jgi:hypothetical protein